MTRDFKTELFSGRGDRPHACHENRQMEDGKLRREREDYRLDTILQRVARRFHLDPIPARQGCGKGWLEFDPLARATPIIARDKTTTRLGGQANLT